MLIRLPHIFKIYTKSKTISMVSVAKTFVIINGSPRLFYGRANQVSGSGTFLPRPLQVRRLSPPPVLRPTALQSPVCRLKVDAAKVKVLLGLWCATTARSGSMVARLKATGSINGERSAKAWSTDKRANNATSHTTVAQVKPIHFPGSVITSSRHNRDLGRQKPLSAKRLLKELKRPNPEVRFEYGGVTRFSLSIGRKP